MNKIFNLLFFFILSMTFSCANDDDTVIPEVAEEIILYDNVKIIEANEFELDTAAQLLDAGTYTFKRISGQTTISIGNIILGELGQGYIRKVTSVNQSDNIITVQTTQASLEEVFKKGTFSFGADLTGMVLSAREKTLGNSSFGGSGFEFSITGRSLYSSPSIEMEFNSFDCSFDPNLEFRLNFSNGQSKFEMGANNANFLLNFDSKISASASADIVGLEEPIAQSLKVVIIPIPVRTKIIRIPVILTLDVFAKLSANFTGPLSCKGNFKSTSILNFGVKYENSVWSKTDDFTTNASFHATELEVNTLQASAIVTAGIKLSAKILGVAGPFVSFAHKENFSASSSTPLTHLSDRNASMKKSFETKFGVEAGFMNHVAASFNYNHESTPETIYEIPKTVEKVSGDNQVGNIGQVLPMKCKVVVKDGKGEPWSNIPVHFDVSQGGGSVPEDVILTDNSGYAEVSWTMGNIGVQELKVTVKKADGSSITDIPIVFNASSGCSGNISDVDGNSYSITSIGSMCIMQQNLNVTHFRNGDEIPQVSPEAWVSAVGPAYYNSLNGKLYNFAALLDSRGLAPEGWHVLSPFEAAYIANTESNGFNPTSSGFICGICFPQLFTYGSYYWVLGGLGSDLVMAYNASSGYFYPFNEFSDYSTFGCPVRCVKN